MVPGEEEGWVTGSGGAGRSCKASWEEVFQGGQQSTVAWLEDPKASGKKSGGGGGRTLGEKQGEALKHLET